MVSQHKETFSSQELTPEQLKAQEIAEVVENTQQELVELSWLLDVDSQFTAEDLSWWAESYRLSQEHPDQDLASLITQARKNNKLRIYEDRWMMKFDINFYYNRWEIQRNYNIILQKDKKSGKVTGRLDIPWPFNDEKYEKARNIWDLLQTMQDRIEQEEWELQSQLKDSLEDTMNTMQTIFSKMFFE